MKSTQESPEVLYLVQEAAEMAGLKGSEHVLYRMVSEGKLRALKLRRELRIPASEVQRIKVLLEEERDAMTVRDVAEDLRMSATTVRRMMSSGEIPARRRQLGPSAGGFILPREDYLAWRRDRLSG